MGGTETIGFITLFINYKTQKMKKNQNLKTTELNDEILSVNENIFGLFSIEELEQRLQASEAVAWGCTCDGIHVQVCE